jgi:5-methylthioadenosine/S-adenosylhomocysteine deaminase
MTGQIGNDFRHWQNPAGSTAGVGSDRISSRFVLVRPGEPVGRVDPGEAELHPPYGSTGGLGSGHAVGMPYYRRKRIAGGTYFFTVNLRDRRSRSGLLEYANTDKARRRRHCSNAAAACCAPSMPAARCEECAADPFGNPKEPRMPQSLIRSRAMVTHAVDRHRSNEIADGAVVQHDGIIVEIGTYAELSRKHPDLPVIGTGGEIAVPGFVNGHHHIGLTPVQLGSPDMPLELWFVTRMVMRSLNLYLDTLYSAFEMIGSGVTTVQHLHGWAPGKLAQVEAAADEVIRAYDDVGMRVSYSFAVRDQNRLVYQRDEDFVASLPAELRGPMQRWYDRFQLSLDDHIALFQSLYGRHHDKRRIKIQLAPANLHWCSDAALGRLAETAERYHVPLHMHLVETAYQKEYARRRGDGGTAVEYLDRFGLLGPQMTLGHGVWLNASDIERVAATGTCVCHNCSSNFRLRSGVAALNELEMRGVTTAIGMDEAGINDDRDMLQEMRMVLRAHRVPGMEQDDVPTPAQVFRMGTSGGARTTGFANTIGTLAVGRAADIVLIDWRQISFPYLDAETPLLDAILQRAKPDGVRTVVCDGEVIYADGKFTKVDRDGALNALHADLQRALSDDEVERRRLSKALLPHVKAFYAGYFDPAQHRPFYAPSSRV